MTFNITSGANIRVTDDDFFNGALSKLRASDGKLLGTFNVGAEPDSVSAATREAETFIVALGLFANTQRNAIL